MDKILFLVRRVDDDLLKLQIQLNDKELCPMNGFAIAECEHELVEVVEFLR